MRRAFRAVSLALIPVCVIAWPVTSLTVFSGEPQGVLALSWAALIYGAANTFITLDVNVEVHDES